MSLLLDNVTSSKAWAHDIQHCQVTLACNCDVTSGQGLGTRRTHGGGSAAAPVIFAAAISHGDATADAQGFAFCLYRISASKQPTPSQRVVVDLVKEVNVT